MLQPKFDYKSIAERQLAAEFDRIREEKFLALRIDMGKSFEGYCKLIDEATDEAEVTYICNLAKAVHGRSSEPLFLKHA